MSNWQTRKIQINGVDVTYRVTRSLKHVQVLLNDNFASAEEFLSLRSMLAGILHYRETQHNKRVQLGARVNRFCKVNKAAAAINITLTMQIAVEQGNDIRKAISVDVGNIRLFTETMGNNISEMRDMQFQANGYLQEISKNTYNLHQMKDDLSELKKIARDRW